jgi:hypothetical protein
LLLNCGDESPLTSRVKHAGGPSFTGSSHTANNYPLKGSKMLVPPSDFSYAIVFWSALELLCIALQH